jgi:hypothetical protein
LKSILRAAGEEVSAATASFVGRAHHRPTAARNTIAMEIEQSNERIDQYRTEAERDGRNIRLVNDNCPF